VVKGPLIPLRCHPAYSGNWDQKACASCPRVQRTTVAHSKTSYLSPSLEESDLLGEYLVMMTKKIRRKMMMMSQMKIEMISRYSVALST
jgi:hypothetical protein